MSTDAYQGAWGPGTGDVVTFVTVTQQINSRFNSTLHPPSLQELVSVLQHA